MSFPVQQVPLHYFERFFVEPPQFFASKKLGFLKKSSKIPCCVEKDTLLNSTEKQARKLLLYGSR
jgi:hypothetical protein